MELTDKWAGNMSDAKDALYGYLEGLWRLPEYERYYSAINFMCKVYPSMTLLDMEVVVDDTIRLLKENDLW